MYSGANVNKKVKFPEDRLIFQSISGLYRRTHNQSILTGATAVR